MFNIVRNVSEMQNGVAFFFLYNFVHRRGVAVRIGKNKVFQRAFSSFDMIFRL